MPEPVRLSAIRTGVMGLKPAAIAGRPGASTGGGGVGAGVGMGGGVGVKLGAAVTAAARSIRL